MPMLIIGVLLLAAKVAEFGPFANWSWWIILAPFALAALWWEFADASGLTKRRAMDKMEARKVSRREKAMEALGLSTQRQKMQTKISEAKARAVSADPTHSDAPPPEPPRREPRR